jgi:hypothetical protein
MYAQIDVRTQIQTKINMARENVRQAKAMLIGKCGRPLIECHTLLQQGAIRDQFDDTDINIQCLGWMIDGEIELVAGDLEERPDRLPVGKA